MIEDILNNPCVRNWVKEVIKEREENDIVDMLHDIDLLKEYFEKKWYKIKDNRIETPKEEAKRIKEE